MNRRARSRAAAVVMAAAATLAHFTIPAHADPTPAPSPAPSSASVRDTDGPGDDDEPRAPLTPAEVKRQLAEATKLETTLASQDAQLAAASRKLADLSGRSSAAMDKVTQARAAEAKALAHEKAQLARLKQLAAETAKARRDLTNMAYDAYVRGPDALREMAALVDLVTGGERTRSATTVDYLSRERAADEKRYAALTAEQRRTAQAAATARAQRQAATDAAEKAQAEVAAAVKTQQAALVDLQRVSAATRARLEDLGVDTSGVGTGVDLASLAKVSTTPLCTQETGAFPNGMIPGSALCPIAGFSGHMMRPDAARGLNALKAAYAKSMGRELCLTDTYRSYAAQVDVRRRKPSLAAVPGTSNHGLGLAVDLCGGIENFGTAEHRWMQQHAPLFGFYHPAWAQAGGSKPEPWHWEFAS